MMPNSQSDTPPFQPQSSSTPRKPSTPYQLWREEHLKQELNVHQSVAGPVPSMPVLVARSVTDPVMTGRATSSPARPPSSQSAHPSEPSQGARKHPPTRLYIESDPQQKVETFVRWKQQQQEREQRSWAAQSEAGSETRHLSELERQIEAVQQIEGGATSDAAGSTASEERKDVAEGVQKEKKEKKKSSLSSMISSVFNRKKTSSSSPLPKKKKSSLSAMIEAQGAPSILDPEAQQRIIEQQAPTIDKSPYQEWRSQREQGLKKEGSYLSMGPPMRPDELAGLRGPTPDPDYDNMSIRSDSSLGSLGPRAPRIREEESEGSEVGSDYGGRFTPRSAKSEYGRRVPNSQTTSMFTGFGRGSPSPSPTPPPGVRSEPGGVKRNSVDSFFGKNGATVGEVSSSQIWYQRYKHTSFNHPNQNTQFGDPIYGTFDGRITNKRGEWSFSVNPARMPPLYHQMRDHRGATPIYFGSNHGQHQSNTAQRSVQCSAVQCV
jgi:hypothetical protein